MRLSFQFPTRAVKHWESWAGPHSLAEIAVAAEEAGIDMISTTDHPFPARDWLANGGHHAFDPFVALSFMAAATRRIRLMTFVLVAGYRSPYLTAKATASLDLLSGGRLVVGMGAGYQEAEFGVLDASFSDRGPRFDAAIAAMRAAWSGEPVHREGPHYPADDHVMLPRPAQRPGPPIWIGGNSKAALRRVAALGDGWLPFEQSAAAAAVTGTPTLAVDEFAERVRTLKAARVAAGRSPDVDVCYSPATRRDVERTIDQLSSALPAYRAAGATWVSIESHARSAAECLREVVRYGEALGSRTPAVAGAGAPPGRDATPGEPGNAP
ncbi:TIGR03619 family F420-dependent LLM class oxidoreductase [Cryptosporangium aurantiacum]|uniref:Probable F420-dependent oxidoreductase, Rv2161c family n=1 Tax=Cryptosporangium aurantiacum TaxID=134849 RepID=A0A1M7PHP5_9ACTN|nr:TIGR03619 family F420-dependent LLM class oxidoreductase [Cryptosporangium aurantiacum]SHN16450.1 probable F420-dependent oxidoreductase, Rv2161c family [Cryptosporangium aurantiacum]